MLFISHLKRYASKGFPKNNNIINFQKASSSPTSLLFKCSPLFSSTNLIQEVNEIKEGSKFYEEKNFEGAQELFQRALNIIPFYLQGNAQFNNQFESFLEQLIRTYAWRGKNSKIQAITSRIINQGQEKKIKCKEQILNILQILSIVGKNTVKLTQQRQTIKELFKLSFSCSQDANFKIQKELSFKDKTVQNNSTSLEFWIHGQLRNTWAFILLHILSKNHIYYNENYNKLCSTLLKNTQRSNQKNIIKPLLILITNLLRNQQYLQAEGMISYCLDRKKENIKSDVLLKNQEYILLNLLLGRTFMGVKREVEGSKLFADYRKQFNFESFIIQGYLLDSI